VGEWMSDNNRDCRVFWSDCEINRWKVCSDMHYKTNHSYLVPMYGKLPETDTGVNAAHKTGVTDVKEARTNAKLKECKTQRIGTGRKSQSLEDGRREENCHRQHSPDEIHGKTSNW
jgi:hypothetical protein